MILAERFPPEGKQRYGHGKETQRKEVRRPESHVFLEVRSRDGRREGRYVGEPVEEVVDVLQGECPIRDDHLAVWADHQTTSFVRVLVCYEGGDGGFDAAVAKGEED